MTGKSCDENHYHLTVCSHEWTNREPVCATPSFTFPLPPLLPLRAAPPEKTTAALNYFSIFRHISQIQRVPCLRGSTRVCVRSV